MDILLKKGVNPNVRNRHEQTPLILAAGNGHLDVVNRLIEAGAMLDLVSRVSRRYYTESDTALTSAVENEHSSVACRLLEAGANLRLRIHLRVLNLAVSNKDRSTISCLLLYKASLNSSSSSRFFYAPATPLMIAAASGQYDVVGRLINEGANLDLESGTSMDEQNKMTALALASREGHVNIVRRLLDAGANPNTGFNPNVRWKRTALTWAKRGQYREQRRGVKTGKYSKIVDLLEEASAKDGTRDHRTFWQKVRDFLRTFPLFQLRNYSEGNPAVNGCKIF